jgi:hypothetical protein
MGDTFAGPSLLLAKQDLAHREHLHQHIHNHLHRRQVTAVFTEVVATISVVQQVDVDINGSTYSTETLTTESSPSITTEETNENAATTSTEAVGAPTAIGGGGESGGADASQSLHSDQGITSATTQISIPTHFPTLALSTNSTSCRSPMPIENRGETNRAHSNFFNR